MPLAGIFCSPTNQRPCQFGPLSSCGIGHPALPLLVKERLIVILPSDHRLAALKAISQKDLAGETFVIVSHTAPVLRAVIDNYLKRFGINITPAHKADHVTMGISLIMSMSTRGLYSETANAAGARIYCGEAHAEVYISRWFDSVCAPPKPKFIQRSPLSHRRTKPGLQNKERKSRFPYARRNSQ